MTISTRPTPPPVNRTTLSARFAINDDVLFVPGSQVSHMLMVQGIPARVVGITFEAGKVLYDLAMPCNVFDFYYEYPIMRVDSVFVYDNAP